MKVLFSARHFVVRFVLASLLIAGALTAALQSSASVAAGHTGQALALHSALKRAGLPASLIAQLPHNPTGRFAYPRNYYQPRRQAGGRGLHSNAAGPSVTINEGVQTYDVFAPPPGFQPGDGSLTPTNQTPVWTADGRFIVFSSNRGGDGHFHLWSISASGDNAADISATPSLHQITSGTGDEFFPALTPGTNRTLAFVSTAGNGVQNLYDIDNFDPTTTQVDVTTLTSLTIRNRPGDPNGLNTHFGKVDRPTWSPDGTRLAFSAVDSDGANAGVHHLWFLFVNTGGGQPGSNGPSPQNPPAKLTDGPADDTDPAWTPDASVDLIAFASTAASGFTAGSPGNAAVSSAPAVTPLRSIYVITSNSANPQQVTTAGQDDFGPAWNLNPTFAGYLTFARGTDAGANHGIYFLTGVYQSGSSTITSEVGGNALQINTDDLPVRGAPNNPGNLYTKVYPSWSPLAVGTTQQPQAVVYSSNRSVTYNDPTTGNPVESAISLAQGTDGVGMAYTGLLISRFDDVDPPTLLPYSIGENIHVTNGIDNNPRRNGDIAPGNPVTFTVRLSNREAGIDDNNVYLQIKDPDSKYQDSDSREHKVFTRDILDSINFPDGSSALNGASSSSIFLYNGGIGGAFSTNNDQSPLFDQLYGAPDAAVSNYGLLFAPYTNVAEAEQTFTFNNNPYIVHERGAVAGQDGGTAISVGLNAGGTSPITITTGTPAVARPLGDGDPAAYQSYGQEYECQTLDASYNSGGSLNTADTDYTTPYYLAGVDDQGSHSGGSHPPPTDANNNLVWLPLARLPDAQQDASGGVLYSATWTTPTSASDYYLDVIAYDKAVEPLTPDTTAANWRIYDNLWGFSTQPFQGGKDILVVSDNTLGQKFVGSTFTGNGLENLAPVFYGAESYYTDIDINLLPNAIYRYISVSGQMPMFTASDGTVVPLLDTLPLPEVINLQAVNANFEPGANANPTAVLNGLGVNSYNDGQVSQQTSVVGGFAVPVSQQYSLWRILARGAVDPQVLNAYSPTFQSQPAVNDPLTRFTAPAATVPVNHRCVIWASPYMDDLPLNTVGSLADGAVQNELRAFVLGGTSGTVTFPGGGRLFVSGANVASTLGSTAATNSTGSFITDVLSASSVGTQTNSLVGGSQNLSGGAENLRARISGDSFFNPDKTVGINDIENFFTQYVVNSPFAYAAPNSQPLLLGNNYIDVAGRSALWRNDGSLDQLGPVPSSFGSQNVAESQISLITPQNGATTDASFNFAGPGTNAQTGGTGPGLIYNLNVGPNGAVNGARVAFSSFGLEGIGIEYYKITPTAGPDLFFARNQRPNILHNVVNFLRTATVFGRITQGSNGGQNASNAIVYLLPNEGVPIPGTGVGGGIARQTYSALTASDGSYQIQGVEPGAYFAVVYKAGFQRIETSFQNVVEGDTSISFNLNLTPVAPGSITGKVKDINGNGIGGAALTFTSVDGLTKVTGISRADGTYTITGVPPTNYNSSVAASGFRTQTAPDAPTANPFTVTSSQTIANVNFTLAAIPGTVAGLVLDVFNGQPVGGAKIAVTNQAGQIVLDANGNPTVFTTAATATNTPSDNVTGDGRPANFTGLLPQGTYTLTLVPPANYNSPTPVAISVTVTSGGFTRVLTPQSPPPYPLTSFTLTSTLGALQGTVTDAGTGAAIAGATVTVTQTDPNTTNTQTFTTAANGTYGPAPLTQGNYSVTVSAPTYLTQTLPTFAITSHQTTTKNVQLVSTLGTFGGLVTDFTSGQTLAGASVSITNASGTAVGGSPLTTGATTATSPADASGKTYAINFGPTTLPAVDANNVPITYTVNVTKQGGGTTTRPDYIPSQTFTVTLTRGRFTVQNVTLVSAVGTLGGLITDSYSHALLAGSTITVADSTGNVVATLSGRNSPSSPTTPAGDGNPLNYSTGLTLYGGTGTTYTITASATNHSSQTFKKVVTGSQFSRQDISLVSTIGTVGGLVLDSSSGQPVAGATVTIADSTGAVVTTYSTTPTTSTAAAPSGDNSPVNYSGPLQQGTYSATVSKRGYGTSASQSFVIQPNQFTRIDFSGATNGLPPVHVFGAGFNFFSVPYDYASIGVGFDQLFGTLNTGTRAAPSAGSNRSHIFVWSPQVLQYVLDPQAPADGLHLGQGYWVYLSSPHEVTVAGSATTARSVAVSLHQGWNQIGVPSPTAISLSALTFNNPATGGTISFADASGATYRLVSSPLYGYNGTSYVAMTSGSSLQPWQAYWIYAFADTTVNIPTS